MSYPRLRSWRRLLCQRKDKKWDNFSWLTLRALLSSANDVIAKGAPNVVRDLRSRWVASQRTAVNERGWSRDLIIPMTDADSFLVLGDPGEQDASQYAVVPVLDTQADADFMVICSDVIYPAGDVNDYVDGFYLPYQHFPGPIFAIPGNHDWYDGLNGFMWHFCGAEALPRADYLGTSYGFRERLARRLWRRASRPDRDALTEWRNQRAPSGGPWQAPQPGPYWAVEMDDLVVVGVDTGITGELDREQGDWLLRVSKLPKPKVLLTGKPLLVDYEHRPGRIIDAPGGPMSDFPTVDEVVRHPHFGYVAAIGGDIHNYQHYRVAVPERQGGQLDYVVSGGSGAFMSATHSIPVTEPLKPDKHHPELLDGVEVEHFECYPDRVASLRFYSRRLVPRVQRLVWGIAGALGGVGVAALLVLVFDLDADVLRTALAVTATLLGSWIALIGLGLGRATRRTGVPGWRRRISLAMSVVTGLTLGLAGWWLAPERFEENLAAAAALTAGGALLARVLRALGPRAWSPVPAQIAIYVAQLVATLVVVYLVAPSSARPEILAIIAVLALIVVVPGFNLLLGPRFPTLHLATALLLAGAGVALVVLMVDSTDEVRAVVTALAVLALLVAAPLAIDYARRVSPKGYRWPILIVAGVVLGGLGVYDTWVVDAAVAAAVVLGTALLGIAVAHLTFLGAYWLLWPFGTGGGELSVPQAERGLAWRDGHGAKPAERRTRRILNLVYPGSVNPRGPLQRKVSEIFDSDEPPFYKSFLRLDVSDGALTIRCFGVSGEEQTDDDLHVVEEIAIPLPRMTATT